MVNAFSASLGPVSAIAATSNVALGAGREVEGAKAGKAEEKRGAINLARWEKLVKGLRTGDAAGGFVAAVEICGSVLAEHFPPIEGDNPNELPDHVVVIG